MDVNRVVKIEIPKELKESFQKERQLKNIRFGDMYKRNIQDGLNENDIAKVLDEINKVRYHLRKVGFYKNFPEWLDFTLISLMCAEGIDIQNKWQKSDMYSSLENVNWQLQHREEEYDLQFLSEQAAYMTHKVKDGMYYNPNIDEMCRLFTAIGLGILDPYQLADSSYESFFKSSQEKLPNSKQRVKRR